jgi:thiol-disulfide isomerase/thioredoxin
MIPKFDLLPLSPTKRLGIFSRQQPSHVGLLFLILMSMCAHARENNPEDAGEGSSTNTKLGSLLLANGDVYRGEIALGKDVSGKLVWKCPAFMGDLVFPWSAVERVSQPASPSETQLANTDAQGLANQEFVFELHNGETFSGQWADLTADHVEVRSPWAGVQQLPRSDLRSILRAIPASASDTGILQPDMWKQMVPAIKPNGRSKWFSRSGSMETETAGTAISQPVFLPDLAAIDLDVTWEQAAPNWMLTVGEPRRLELHFRKLETRNMISITMLVDDETSADIATSLISSEGVSSISLRILCDSNRGRFVLLKGGTAIAQIKMAKAVRLNGNRSLTFTNIGSGRLSLRELKVYTSIFSAPSIADPKNKDPEDNQVRSVETLLQTGETYLGVPTGFDRSDGTFGFEQTSIDLGRVAVDQVSRIEFPSRQESDSPNPSNPPIDPLYQLDLRSGARYSGQSIQRMDGNIVLELVQAKVRVSIPVSEIVSIGINGNRAKPDASDASANAAPANAEPANPAPVEASPMKLSSPWGTSLGRIDKVDVVSANAGNEPRKSLFWKPLLAEGSCALASSLSGTIDPVAASAGPAKPARSAYGQISKTQKEPVEGRSLRADEPSLFLTNGDCFPAIIKSLDEMQTVFHSTMFEGTKINNELIRGIRVLAHAGMEQLDSGAQKKLLTLPRMQRSNPPTHLIVARQGDAIRGRLKSINDDFAVLEVRGSDRSIMMKTIAEIIWLIEAPEVVPLTGQNPESSTSETEKSETETSQAESSEPQKREAAISNASESLAELQCQALFDTGARISMVPSSISDNILSGMHPQLGVCQIDLASVNRLVLGDAIAAEATKSRFGKWKLENAPDPKFVNDLDDPDAQAKGGSGNGMSPQLEALVGAIAPAFELPLLEGERIRLEDLRGKIVVLDFWATWCGPCIASLPKLNEIAQEYRGANVQLIAVNIEQKPSEIKSMLGKLEIKPTVALDSDGAVAKAYFAEAIPQTVIIDANGKIVKIVVGGGEDAEKQIRATLDSLIQVKY